MMRGVSLSVLFSGLVLIAPTVSAQAQDVEDLLPFVPEDANAIAVIRARALKDSPRGKAEDWEQQHEANFLAGAATVPPWVDVLVRASHARPGIPGGDWTVLLTHLPEDFDMADLAERQQAELQDIDGHSLVHSAKHNGYFVELTRDAAGSNRVLGAMEPATRQNVARWLQESSGNVGALGLSDFLSAAAQEESALVMLAFDMEHMLDPGLIRYRLNGAAALEGKAREKSALTILLQTVKGIRFDVHVDDEVSAQVHLEFGRQVGPEGEYIKPLLVEFMDDAGATLDEMASAQTNVEGRRVTLSMPLSDESLRRVLSLITTPTPHDGREAAVAGQPPETEPKTDSDDDSSQVDVARSRRYFNSVNGFIDDLSRAYGRAKSYAKTAQWHVNFAERIEKLPTRGVDPDLTYYGQWVATQFRALGASLQGTAVQVNALEKSVVYNVNAQPGYYSGADAWWGGARTAWGPYTYGRPTNVEVTSNLQQVREQQAQAVSETAPQREQIWQMINDERAAMQRKMIGRYGDTFGR